ncbi:MAG: MFS transporter [Propionibacteriaceae bacterium]|jgi:MFS family permease|nr:MFS transporter [Propionibacteriaceae bacterium]
MAKKTKTKFDWRITSMVALAVFAQEVTWNFYDAQVPPLLREHVTSAALIGLFMGLDNFLGIFIQPWLGNISDRTRTRRGRRMPFIIVGMPLAAVFFVCIPYAPNLPLLVAFMVAYAVVAKGFKPVAEALMPDYIGPEHRSRANAIVKVATTLTLVVSALISLFVIDEHPQLAFAIPAAIMVAIGVVLWLQVNDSESPGYQAAVAEAQDKPEERAPRVRTVLWRFLTNPDRSGLFMLLVVFAFAGAWAASRSLLTTFGIETLGMTRGRAGALGLAASIIFIAAAIPTALIAERIGRIKTIGAGIVLFGVGIAVATAVPSELGVEIALCLCGIGYAGYAINAVVVFWNLSSARTLGTYTGFYAIASASGAATGPAIVGVLVDLTGWRLMFLDTGILALAALAFLLAVAHYAKRNPTTPEPGVSAGPARAAASGEQTSGSQSPASQTVAAAIPEPEATPGGVQPTSMEGDRK